MHRGVVLGAAGALLLAGHVSAQATLPTTTSPALRGDWYGSSLCTAAGKPACHDESVVYHFTTQHADSAHERLTWVMNKIVNGQEENMATLACDHVLRAGTVACPMRGTWLWSFDVRADTLVGVLRAPSNVVWRNIRVVRRPH